MRVTAMRPRGFCAGVDRAIDIVDQAIELFASPIYVRKEIVDAVRHVLEEIRDNEPLPDFVAERLPQLDLLIQMLADDEWQLPTDDRERLLAMFVYFSDPEDILPDHIPVIGYLDDVIIIELVTRDMQHVREAYDDYRTFRREFDVEHGKDIDGAIRRDRLDRQRQQLHQRMQRRSKRGAISKIW